MPRFSRTYEDRGGGVKSQHAVAVILKTIDPCIPTTPRWSTSGIHRPGRRCLHQGGRGVDGLRLGDRETGPKVMVQSWLTIDRNQRWEARVDRLDTYIHGKGAWGVPWSTCVGDKLHHTTCGSPEMALTVHEKSHPLSKTTPIL